MDGLGSVTTVNGDTNIHPEKINAKRGFFLLAKADRCAQASAVQQPVQAPWQT
jgi:hypothetical protein